MKNLFILLFTTFMILTISSCQFMKTNEIPVADGEQLVRQLWNDFKTNDRETLDNWLAAGFQSVHQDGARDRSQELELLVKLNLGEYELNDFRTTQSGGTVVVTYSVSVYETIDDKVLPKAPAERLSVFVFEENDWKWVAHANLNPMNK